MSDMYGASPTYSEHQGFTSRPELPTAPVPRDPRRASVKWTLGIMGAIFVPVMLGLPFVTLNSRRHRTRNTESIYEQFGWPGVIGVWLFYVGIGVVSYVIYRKMRRRQAVSGPAASQGADAA